MEKQETTDNKYDLSFERYKKIEYEEVEYDPPLVILDQLEALKVEIQLDLKECNRSRGQGVWGQGPAIKNRIYSSRFS